MIKQPKNSQEKFDNILEALEILVDSKDFGIYLLVGSNGSGKSLVRNQLAAWIADERGLKSGKGLVASVSMQKRTESNPEWGALSSMMHDCSWHPTSFSTLKLIEGLINSASKETEWLVIDEPEIGMGEELQLSMIPLLNDLAKDRKVLIISHSRLIIQGLNLTKFLSLDGYSSKEEWLNREITPASLSSLRENALFKFIQEKTKETK